MKDISRHSLILFQGDSITNCGRNHDDINDLGNGYVFFIAKKIENLYPKRQFNIINRGINGNTIENIYNRWQNDCINLRPDLVSILVGINDCYLDFLFGKQKYIDKFESTYRRILNKTRESLHANILLCEPFLLPLKDEHWLWRNDLNSKIAIVRHLALEYEAFLLPLNEIFIEACEKTRVNQWTEDGIHPNKAGHELIAESWIDAVATYL